LGHLCRASGVAAEIRAAYVPLSPQARAAGPEWLVTCLTGGDDYELLLAVPPANEAALQQAAQSASIAVTRIGSFRSGPPRVTVQDDNGQPMTLLSGGWSHF
ncbi:MAG TPA: thiamine-phosphate kinase, partial [Acetobacteraceae bacterium]|nr:thiamine-phosphate kinase [Acetobacteraceae bacterium]